MIISKIPMFETYTMLSDSNFSQGFLANVVSLDGHAYGQTVFSTEIKASAENGVGMPIETDRGFVHYIFQASRDHGYKVMSTGASSTEPSPGLRINRSLGPIGSMDEQAIMSALASAGMKHGHRYTSISFDFRSLLYICGFYVGRATASVDIAPPDPEGPLDLDCLTREGFHDIKDSVILTAAMCTGKDEVMTATCLLGMAGVTQLFTVAQQIDDKGVKFRNLTLGAYCAKLAASVISQAKEIGCGATHVLAYMRGLSHAITIRAHSDEGGIVRELLSHCSYPPSTGVLNPSVFEFHGISNTAIVTRIARKRLCAHATKLLFLLASAATAADPGSEMGGIKIPRALFRVSAAPTRPSDWYNFDSAVSEWASRLIDNVHAISGFVNIESKDVNSYLTLLSDDAPNRHVRRRGVIENPDDPFSETDDPLMPFFWIECSPINPGFNFPYFMPFDHNGGSNTFATFPFADIKVLSSYRDDAITHRASRGTKLFLYPKTGTTFRSMGAMYLYSNQLSSGNGLTAVQVVRSSVIEKRFQPFGMTSPQANTLAEARWTTPHSCIPHPASGLTFDNHLLVINYSDVGSLKLPSKWTLENKNLTAVGNGPLFINNAVTTSKHRIPTDKFIPRRVFRTMVSDIQFIGDEAELENLLDQLGDHYQNPLDGDQTLESFTTVSRPPQLGDFMAEEESLDGLPGTFGAATIDDGSDLVGVGRFIKKETLPKQSVRSLFPGSKASAKAAVSTTEADIAVVVDEESIVNDGLVIPSSVLEQTVPLELSEAESKVDEDGKSGSTKAGGGYSFPVFDPDEPLSDTNYGLTDDQNSVYSIHFTGSEGSLVHNGEKVTPVAAFESARLKLHRGDFTTQITDSPVRHVRTGSHYDGKLLHFRDPKTKVTFQSAFNNKDFFNEASAVFTLIKDSKTATDTVSISELKAGLSRNFIYSVDDDNTKIFSFTVGNTYIRVPVKISTAKNLDGERR